MPSIPLSTKSPELWSFKGEVGRDDLGGYTIKLGDGAVLGTVREKKQIENLGYLLLDDVDADHRTLLLPGGLVETVDHRKRCASIMKDFTRDDVRHVTATTDGRGMTRFREPADTPGLPFSSS